MQLVKVLSFLTVLLSTASALAPAASAWWTMPPFAFHKLETPRWMAWHGGVDLFGTTGGAEHPNVLIHVAERVATPVGAAPSGMILWQPDPKAPPELFGFLSTDETTVGPWFGPQIFAGTPFEQAPTLKAKIQIVRGEGSVTAKIEVGKRKLELTLSELGPTMYMNRAPSAQTPFYQNGVERAVGKVVVKVDGKVFEVTPAPMNPTGGPGAVYAEFGSYAR
ncbi:MAG: hypothetical protein IT385_25340 [Deltaproteobacteria bacterium]|nr:hypothetical protein [Deltaproteobacteria bacterium]